MSKPALGNSAFGPRATKIRYLVVALTTLMAFVLYLDRFCLSFAEQYIKHEMALNDNQISLLLGAFFLAYALGQVPAGWLSDRYGARLMLTIYILLWSLFTGWMGLAMSFGMVLALRLGCGLAQAGAFPTGAGVISKWVLFSSRGLASAIVAVGGRIGGAAAPILTAFLIIACVPAESGSSLSNEDILDAHGMGIALQGPWQDSQGQLRRALHGNLMESPWSHWPPESEDLRREINRRMSSPDLFVGVAFDKVPLEAEGRDLARIAPDHRTAEQTLRLNRFLLEAAFPEHIRKYYAAGWRPVMMIYGVAGVLIAAWYWHGIRNKPRGHPLCNAAEAELIERSLPASAPNPHGKVGALPFKEIVRHASLWLNSLVQFFTNFGWAFLLTWLPRYLTEVYEVPVVERGWMVSFPIFAGMFGMFAGGWLTDWAATRFGVYRGRMLPVMLTRFLAAAAFFTCTVIRAPWPVTIVLALVAVATDLGTPALWAYAQDVGGRHAGSVLGWGNMWGNFGAALSPWVLNQIKVQFNWNAVFITCGLAFLVAGIGSFGIDATKPLLPSEKELSPG